MNVTFLKNMGNANSFWVIVVLHMTTFTMGLNGLWMAFRVFGCWLNFFIVVWWFNELLGSLHERISGGE